MARNEALRRTPPREEELVADSLRAAADEILGDARRQIEEPAADDATAVHDFRKAMKRWRALLRLLEPLLGEEATRLRIEARDLARELAGTRDVRSALDALHDLGDAALSARTIAALRHHLELIGASAEAATLTNGLRARIREALDKAAGAASGWMLGDVAFAAIADGLALSYARARNAIPEDWASAEPGVLHVLRQRVVVHRYQMELAIPLWPKLGRAWVSEAQKLRDRLGLYQDLVVLGAFTAPRQPLARWRSRLAPLITTRQAEHTATAARVAHRLFAEKPKAFRRRLISLWDSRLGH